MNASGAVASLVLVTVVYVGALLWVDAQGGLLTGLAPGLPGMLGVLLAAAIVSWVIRFCRWHWLMGRAGFRPAWWPAWLGYLSGFSFTATPGKVGELIRIRYFDPLGVPAPLVVGLFVYERCLDLLAVLILAMLAMNQFEQFWIAAGFALALVAVVVVTAGNGILGRLCRLLARRNLGGVARAVQTLDSGLAEARRWVRWHELAASLALGLLAWSMLALSFCWLLGRLGIDLPLSTSLAIYPLSMLVGAASMLPGGLGSTEATIVALLALNQAPLDVALLAAVAARLSTLWGAIVFGLAALAWSEVAKARRARGR
jgi:uncharacterized protein (TIRG00374 family)